MSDQTEPTEEQGEPIAFSGAIHPPSMAMRLETEAGIEFQIRIPDGTPFDAIELALAALPNVVDQAISQALLGDNEEPTDD